MKGGPRHKPCIFSKNGWQKKAFFVCIFCFKKLFFVNHLLKRYKVLVFLTKMVFLFRFSEGKLVSLQKLRDRLENLCPFLVSLFCPFSPLFEEKGQGRDTRLENLCPYLFTPFPRKGAGKGYQVWTLQSLEQSIIFHTF